MRPSLPSLVALAAMLAAGTASAAKHEAPLPSATLALMAARETSPAAPIVMRTYKKEGELEVWKLSRSGRYVHLKTFPICRWSGQLGPKTRVGDRQTPEGFYSVPPGKMNPNSSYHLSFDIGFPNAQDRARGASGSHLMVHGACSSAGCFSMTDRAVSEIYALAREAFAGGQPAFQFQAFPFRMSAENLARHRTDPHIAFWRQLKEGADRFEAGGEPPTVTLAAGRYAFVPFRDPGKEARAVERRASEDARIAALTADGVAAVRTTYSDGGQHPFFRLQALAGAFGEVSRPEALAGAGREVIVIAARVKPRCPGGAGCPTAIAATASPHVPPAELSIFARAPLGYATRTEPVLTSIAGAAAIRAPELVRATVTLASR